MHGIFNPRCACTARVTVVVLCVCPGRSSATHATINDNLDRHKGDLSIVLSLDFCKVRICVLTIYSMQAVAYSKCCSQCRVCSRDTMDYLVSKFSIQTASVHYYLEHYILYRRKIWPLRRLARSQQVQKIIP